MKKLISILLILVLALSLGTVALAADENDENTTTITDVPGTASDYVYVTSIGSRWRYEVTLENGSGTIDGQDAGFTASVEGAPSDAVKLVVVPITDPDALEWFNGCVGDHWSSTGTIYAVFYEDAEGNRLPAPGVQMSVTVPGGYDNLNVYSVTEGGSATSLNYQSSGASVSFTTDGSLYYGVVHRQGVVEEETDIGPGAPDTTLDMTTDELADAVLTDEDREYLDEGIDIKIKLTVEDITGSVTPAEVSAVESVAGDYTVGEYIDVELLKQVGDQPWVNIHETNKPVRITVTIPERLLGHAEYAIVRVHDGTATFLRDLDSDPNTITFETSLFSTYAILYRDPLPTATPAPTARPSEVPPTGDDTPIALYAAVLFVSLSGIFALAIVRKYRNRDGTDSRTN